MPVTLDDTTVRNQIHADVYASWTPLKIYDDASYGKASKMLLPRSYVRLQDIEPVRAGGTAGLGEVSMMHTYEIVGQFPWPSQTPIEVAKVLMAQALITKLTTTLVYSSGQYRRDVKKLVFTEMFDQPQEPYFEITIEFAVEVVSAA